MPAEDVVIITGGSGLIGAAAAVRLADAYRVIAFDRAGPPHPPSGIETVDLDLTTDEGVRGALARVRARHGRRIAAVVHLAAYYDFTGRPSPKFEEINVRGTGRLLEALRDFDVEQFLFASTMIVHAPCEPGRAIDEDWPLGPKWDYPRSKLQAEQLLRARRGTLPTVLLRIASVYDELCHHVLLAQQIRRIYERRLTGRVYPGDVRRGQAYLHLDDLLDAIERLVRRRAELPPELPLLVGEAETMPYGEIQQALGRLIHGEDWPTYRVPKPLARMFAGILTALPFARDPFIRPWMIDLADDHYALDVGRARRLLGWEPSRSLRQTLPAIVARLRADPSQWYRENEPRTVGSRARAPENRPGTR